MKSNRVAPYFGEVKAKEEQPLEKMRERLARHTKCQTLIISSTTIFNMEALEPLQEIMVQVSLLTLFIFREIIFELLTSFILNFKGFFNIYKLLTCNKTNECNRACAIKVLNVLANIVLYFIQNLRP